MKKGIWNIRRLPMDMARFCYMLMFPFFRLRKRTPEGERYRGKLRGGAILAANHTSFRDPLLLGIGFWYRRVFFLIAEVVMQGKLRSALLRGVGGIRIDRGITDLEAIKSCVSVLKQGSILAMFPQGGIVRDQEVDSVKSGAVLMALQAGVPIIPVHLNPGKHWYSATTMVIGKPIEPKALLTRRIPSTADMERISRLLAEEMNRCAGAQRNEVTQ